MATDKSQLRDLVISALRSRDLESAHAYAQQLEDVKVIEHPERDYKRFGRLRRQAMLCIKGVHRFRETAAVNFPMGEFYLRV